MKITSNILYFIRRKDNDKLPDYFNDYLLNSSTGSYFTEDLKSLINELKETDDYILIEDHGAGSKYFKSNKRKVSQIINLCATKHNYGVLYNKLVKQFSITNILEFGTSLGIGTAYLKGNNKNTNIISVDACGESQKYADNILKKLNISNYNLINNTFDNTLNSNLLEGKKFDMIFIDGNHKGEALKKYYYELLEKYSAEKCILIIDDINWSVDMYKAWQIIMNSHKSNCLILDIFRVGIIFKGFETLPIGNYSVKFLK